MNWASVIGFGGLSSWNSQYQTDKTIASQKETNLQNYNSQKEFLQNGIQWKVSDAQKAGIHPLYALGAQTTGFQPSFVASDYSGYGQIGQNLSNAFQTYANKTMTELQLKNQELQNEYLQAQIDEMTMPKGSVSVGTPSAQQVAVDVNKAVDKGVDSKIIAKAVKSPENLFGEMPGYRLQPIGNNQFIIDPGDGPYAEWLSDGLGGLAYPVHRAGLSYQSTKDAVNVLNKHEGYERYKIKYDNEFGWSIKLKDDAVWQNKKGKTYDYHTFRGYLRPWIRDIFFD